LIALGPSVGEGGALKLLILKKFACLVPPSGVMRRRTLTFRSISIHRRTFSYGSKNQNSRFTGFVQWAIKVAKKLQYCTTPFLAENELDLMSTFAAPPVGESYQSQPIFQ